MEPLEKSILVILPYPFCRFTFSFGIIFSVDFYIIITGVFLDI